MSSHDIIRELQEGTRLPVYAVDTPPISSGEATTEELLREREVIAWRRAQAEDQWGPGSTEAEITAYLVADEWISIDRELTLRRHAAKQPSAPNWPTLPEDKRAEWDEIKRRTDILALAHRLEYIVGPGVQKGPAWWFHCFGHEDNTPSLAVYPATQHFHAFCCGLHGDCIDLARHALRLTSFQATMAVLGEWAGVNRRTVAIQKGDEIVEVDL